MTPTSLPAELPRIPDYIIHNKKLKYHTRPGISQEDFNKKVRATGVLPERQNDLITVITKNILDVTLEGFVEQYSVLAKCPAFKDFFDSENYLPGCATLIYVDETTVALEIMLKYLLYGPMFDDDSAVTRDNLFDVLEDIDDSTALHHAIRTNLFAGKAGLYGLQWWALWELWLWNRKVTMADFEAARIFINEADSGANQLLKNWLVRDLPRAVRATNRERTREFWERYA